MSVTDWTPGELFTVRIYKSLDQRRDIVWSNTYEVRSLALVPANAGIIPEAVESMALWEKDFHLPDVRYDRAVFSTYVPDGEPYSPSSFVTVPLNNIIGGRGTDGTQPVGLNQCLFVRRVVQTGRNGRALYRRCLQESDVQAPAGDPVLTATAQVSLQALVDGVGQENLQDTLSNYQLELVMAATYGTSTVPVSRIVSTQQVAGVTEKKYKNRYFDKP